MFNPSDILKKYWGYDTFRPLQEDIINAVLSGEDVLALLPTGGGKSICFQVPALCEEGICLVISPLIALMKDQVYNLLKRNIPATAIFSGMNYKDIDRILDNCAYGQYKFLYLSPERLKTELAIERIKKMNINLIAVDEAHCISQWGYDFRPPYLDIAEIRELHPDVPIIALTATAIPKVVVDIQEKLNFNKENVLQKSFQRSNISYVVLQEEGKPEKLIDILKKVQGTGIVYVRNRRKTKEIAYWLNKKGIRADYYHAGLSADGRSRKQEDWINNKIRVIVSTNAFGMGIDKPDVRIVVHMDLPDNLEAYFQEAGRAGRDEKKSYAVLLYNEKDKANLQRQFELSFPKMASIRQIYQALGSYFQLAIGSGVGDTFDFDIVDFCNNYKLDVFKTYNCLRILEKEGWITMSEAMFLPSSLMFTIEKEQLYDYQLKNKELDRIIRALLRAYQGVFTNYVYLRNEQQLAKGLKITIGQLHKSFETLHRDKIIDYRPQKDKPQLMFLQERVEAKNLVIDMKMYNFRKERQAYRIEKAIEYAESKKCRSRQLLLYFGEKRAETCGICDVCLGRHKTDLSNQDFNRYAEKIRLLVIKEKLTMEQVLESFSPKRKNTVIKTLEFLMDEEIISKTEQNQLEWMTN